jgi:hypothetical protein
VESGKAAVFDGMVFDVLSFGPGFSTEAEFSSGNLYIVE